MMKIKVFDPWIEYATKDLYNPYYGWHKHSTLSKTTEDWTEMDVTMEELKDLVDKGYKIKINC